MTYQPEKKISLLKQLHNRQIIKTLHNFITENGLSRFKHLDSVEDFAEHKGPTASERVGWVRKVNGQVRHLFSASGMAEALTGYSLRDSVKYLIELGIIVPHNTQKMPTMNLGVDGKNRVYVVNYNKLEDIYFEILSFDYKEKLEKQNTEKSKDKSSSDFLKCEKSKKDNDTDLQGDIHLMAMTILEKLQPVLLNAIYTELMEHKK